MTTSMLVALVNFAIGCFGFYGVVKLETYLESKLSETAGWRTDLLISVSIVLFYILAIFIFYNFLAFVKPIFITLFIK